MGKKLRLIFCQNISLKEFSIKPDKNFTKTYIVHVITSYLLQPCTPTNVKSTLSISRVSFVYSVSCSMHLKRTYEYRSPILQSNLIIVDVFNFCHNDLKTFGIKFVDKIKYIKKCIHRVRAFWRHLLMKLVNQHTPRSYIASSWDHQCLPYFLE